MGAILLYRNEMAEYAKLDSTNRVITIFGSNDVPVDGEFTHVEFFPGRENNPRKNPAYINGYYSPEHDAFMPPKPYESWHLDTENFTWEPPVPYPEDGLDYVWDESSLSWVKQA